MVVQRGVVGRVGAMRVIAPSRGFVPQAQTAQKLLKHAPAPPRNYGQRLELVESTSPQCLTCQSTDKAGYIYSAPLHICQVAPLLLRKHRGWARDQNKYFATAPGHTQRSSFCSVKKHFILPLGIRARAPPEFDVSRAKFHTKFVTFLCSSPPFFSRVLPAFYIDSVSKCSARCALGKFQSLAVASRRR
jgi:hypothetical protein